MKAIELHRLPCTNCKPERISVRCGDIRKIYSRWDPLIDPGMCPVDPSPSEVEWTERDRYMNACAVFLDTEGFKVTPKTHKLIGTYTHDENFVVICSPI